MHQAFVWSSPGIVGAHLLVAWSTLPYRVSKLIGEVTEWPNVPVLKTGVPSRVPGVRIPPSPLLFFMLSVTPVSIASCECQVPHIGSPKSSRSSGGSGLSWNFAGVLSSSVCLVCCVIQFADDLGEKRFAMMVLRRSDRRRHAFRIVPCSTFPEAPKRTRQGTGHIATRVGNRQSFLLDPMVKLVGEGILCLVDGRLRRTGSSFLARPISSSLKGFSRSNINR